MTRSVRFSQSALHDYQECAYRFELRYLRQVTSPAPVAEPLEQWQQMQAQGHRFHLMVQQHALGVPPDAIAARLKDPDLRDWWEHYLRTGAKALPRQKWSELTLSVPVAGQVLLAKLDLLASDDEGNVVIVDWKTHGKARADKLRGRIQTRVYQFVVAEAFAGLTGRAITPEQVEMRYWFAGERQPWVKLDYDAERHEKNRAFLTLLIGEIAERSIFSKTDDLEKCASCTFRSLCDRGRRAAGLDPEQDIDEETEILLEPFADDDFFAF